MTAADLRASSSRSRSGPSAGVGVAAGVQLDSGGAELDGGLDLSGVGVDEKSDVDARVAAAGQRVGDAVALTGHVEASLGRQLFPAFRARTSPGRA